jgi:hypothetical protein
VRNTNHIFALFWRCRTTRVIPSETFDGLAEVLSMAKEVDQQLTKLQPNVKEADLRTQ